LTWEAFKGNPPKFESEVSYIVFIVIYMS